MLPCPSRAAKICMVVFLSLGANLGNREETIDKALNLLAEQVGPLIKRSSFFYSKPWGFDSPNDFCNLCAAFKTALSPSELLHSTQAIERALGRQHKSINGQYCDRTIDIDIIRVFDHEKEIFIDTPKLTIPHPLWHERDFVKVPLEEIMQ